MHSKPIGMVLGLWAGALVVSLASPARAQTWPGASNTPGLDQLIAVDATGESGWLYGGEDLQGDGSTFQQPEQSIDIRTAYAATDNQRLWVRVYVSDTAVPGGNVTAFVFIDSDQNAGTGGSTIAPEINAAFTTETARGFEFVAGVRGQMLEDVWQWDGMQSMYTSLNPMPNQTSVETGTDLDPIRINRDNHGYSQIAVDLDLVGLTQACTANLYVRSVNDIPALGSGDLDVGQVGPCIPGDGNNNGIPDPVEPPMGCTDNAQCPAGGVCVNGRCVIAQTCSANNPCPTGYQCNMNGQCVVTPAGACMDDPDCGELVCDNMQCVACTSAARCGAGRVCAPDGRCISDAGSGGSAGAGPDPNALQPGEELQGGACTCSLLRDSRSPWPALAALGAALGFALYRRRR